MVIKIFNFALTPWVALSSVWIRLCDVITVASNDPFLKKKTYRADLGLISVYYIISDNVIVLSWWRRCSQVNSSNHDLLQLVNQLIYQISVLQFSFSSLAESFGLWFQTVDDTNVNEPGLSSHTDLSQCSASWDGISTPWNNVWRSFYRLVSRQSCVEIFTLISLK